MEIRVGRGVRTYLTNCGEGSAVLFLHGNPDTSELWAGVIGSMAAHHRCLAPDLPAFGRSEAPEDFNYSLKGLASWVNDLAVSLEIVGPMDLVMHDLGGLFGLAWAVTHPEKVRRLAIMNTVFFPDYPWHFWARVWRTPLLGELSFALSTRWALALEMRRGSRRLPMSHARRAYDVMTPAMKRMVLRLYRAMNPENFTAWQEGLRALIARVPVCVLWGDRDPYIDRRFAERFGSAEVHHFPEAGHWLAVEEPDAVAELLLTFFA